jgi:hypothetical protein
MMSCWQRCSDHQLVAAPGSRRQPTPQPTLRLVQQQQQVEQLSLLVVLALALVLVTTCRRCRTCQTSLPTSWPRCCPSSSSSSTRAQQEGQERVAQAQAQAPPTRSSRSRSQASSCSSRLAAFRSVRRRCLVWWLLPPHVVRVKLCRCPSCLTV